MSKIAAPTICLNMIVKNEADIIVDTFNNILERIKIDYWVISDTGSTDKTKEIICNFFKEKGIKGELVEHEWKDFAYNRTKALESAFNKTDYLLIFDADDRFEGQFILPKPKLMNKDSYKLLFGTKDALYYRELLINNRKKWHFKGVLHEVLYEIDKMNRGKGTIEGNYSVISGHFGNRSKNLNKYYDDAIILKNAFYKETNDLAGDKALASRYAFYCGRSFQDAGPEYYLDSVEWYKKVLESINWLQEKYFSCLMIGDIYNHLKDYNQAVRYWIKSSDYDSDRIEGIVKAMESLRNKGDHTMVNLLYKKFKNYNIKNLENEKLFVDRNKYNDLIEYNNSVSAFYVSGEKQTGYECSKKIIMNNIIGEHLLNSVLLNLKFYTEFLILKKEKTKLFSFTLNYEVNGIDYTFNSSSSCIIPNENKDGYLYNVRLVNYRINDEGNYIEWGDKHIITMNKYFELDKNFNITYEKLIGVEYVDRMYIGLEDVRIFKPINKNIGNNINNENNNNLIFTSTGYHKNNMIGIMYGNYDIDSIKSSNYILKSMELMPAFNKKTTCEKNWSFVNYKNETHVIYSWKPLKICKINTQTNEIDLIEEKQNTPDLFRHFRGSTSGFNYKQEIWFVVHWVSYEKPRHYYHILLVFDKNMDIKKYSAPFKFESTCIEYCIGLVVEDERVIMSYSNWDRTTKIGIYDKKYIDSIVVY